ncbi:putative LPS assembly protein LptD, partial [Chitinophagales bacterium]|nr:putative LPS assembly protein LptD [Chitinophagales bacterium]
WTHTQDPKSIPNSTFTARVGAGTSTYNQNFVGSSENFLTNTFNSSINWSRRFVGTPFNLSINGSHSQNTQTKIVTITLPELNFTMSKQTPFLRKKKVGETRWYERIGVSYTANMRNRVSVADSILFTSESLDQMKNGVRHSVPVSTSFNLFKYFTFSPSVNYNEYWYLEALEKEWDPTLIIDTLYDDEGAIAEIDTTFGQLNEELRNGFTTGRDFRTSLSMRTTIYGTKLFSKGLVRGLRHVVRPSLSMSWRPDFGSEGFGFYKEVQTNSDGDTQRYSIFSQNIYGGPPDGKSASLNFTMDNNIEMKVRARKDTITGDKKIKILESLQVRGSYDFARDSLRMGDIRLTARTTLLRKFTLNYSSTFDPYIVNETGRSLNTYEWKENKRLARLSNASLSVNTSFSSKGVTGTNRDPNSVFEEDLLVGGIDEAERRDIYERPDDFVDFKIPWSLNVQYSWRLSKSYSTGVEESNITQTLNFGLDFNVTPKWKVNLSSGYDFQLQDLSYTRINIFRDLHCWEMAFNWIPTGARKRYEFTLKAKSSLLQDLKISRKRDWYDF